MNEPQKNNYSVSTPELVSIGVKEIAKDIPFIGSIISAHEAVFSKIEEDRVDQVLQEFGHRIQMLEDQQSNIQEKLKKTSAYATLIYGCDQARSDILLDGKGGKAKDYGYVIGNLINIEAGIDDVVEVLDSLRKLSAHDLKTLYQFKGSDHASKSKQVNSLVGCNPLINPAIDDSEIAAIRKNMQIVYPTLMRLQGFGVLYLDKSTVIPLTLDIGPLSEHMYSFANLTPMGAKLVQALP